MAANRFRGDGDSPLTTQRSVDTPGLPSGGRNPGTWQSQPSPGRGGLAATINTWPCPRTQPMSSGAPPPRHPFSTDAMAVSSRCSGVPAGGWSVRTAPVPGRDWVLGGPTCRGRAEARVVVGLSVGAGAGGAGSRAPVLQPPRTAATSSRTRHRRAIGQRPPGPLSLLTAHADAGQQAAERTETGQVVDSGGLPGAGKGLAGER